MESIKMRSGWIRKKKSRVVQIYCQIFTYVHSFKAT